MAPDDLLDFLSDGADDPGQRAAVALAAVRSELVEWAAGALLNRHPQARAWRGRKGLMLCRQDLDFHVRHLHAALAAGVPISADGQADTELAAYAGWWPRVLAKRGSHPCDAAIGIDILIESLIRFLAPPHGAYASRVWADAFSERKVASPSSAR